MDSESTACRIEERAATPKTLAAYARISIAFEVRRVLEVEAVAGGLGGMTLRERVVETPYEKDYDAFDNERPVRWARRWDLSNWGVFLAFIGDGLVGGCVVARDTRGVHMLEGRKDIAALWDIRVAPEYRGKGIGTRLFDAAVVWCRARGCRQLKIETQNVNVAACRFYAARGCTLGAINRFGYSEFPDEAQLIWYYGLVDRPA